MYTSTIKSISALAAITIFIAGVAAQETTSTSSFNWDSLISEAATETSTWDLYTTDGELGPGQIDTSSRYGLYTSATPIAGPVGGPNGTATNGTYPLGNDTMTSAGASGPTGGAGGVGGGSDGSETTTGGASGSEGAGAPEQTGAAASAGLWVEGAGLLVGIGALMAAL